VVLPLGGAEEEAAGAVAGAFRHLQRLRVETSLQGQTKIRSHLKHPPFTTMLETKRTPPPCPRRRRRSGRR
jgi:hypothetical protein